MGSRLIRAVPSSPWQSQTAAACHRFLCVVGPLLVAPLCITSFVYTCLYAYIYATENSYGNQDWQKCLVTPNIGNLHLDNNKYCTSASNFAGQAYLSLLVAMVGAHVGLVDNTLLPVSIYTSIVAIVGIIVFREAYPYYDDPHYESTTLITLTQYISPTMYDNLGATSVLPEVLKAKIPSSEVCQTAYKVNLAFLCVQYGILALAVVLFCICTYAFLFSTLPASASARRPSLQATHFHPVFATTAFLAMMTMLICKELVADTAIRVARSTGHNTVYQFTDNNLDMVSLTTLLAIGAAIYALCKQDLMPMKLCVAVGFIHLTRSVPGLLGTLAGYSGLYVWDFEAQRMPPALEVDEKYYVIWKHDECIQYVIDTNKSGFKNDPSARDHASFMCSAFIGSIAGQLSTFLSVACLVVCSIVVIAKNTPTRRPPSAAASAVAAVDSEDHPFSSSSSFKDRTVDRGTHSTDSAFGMIEPLLLNDDLLFDGEEVKAPSHHHGIRIRPGVQV